MIGHMIGGSYKTHDECPCQRTRGWPAALRLAQDLIYYFVKTECVFVDGTSRAAEPEPVFRSGLGCGEGLSTDRPCEPRQGLGTSLQGEPPPASSLSFPISKLVTPPL